MMDRATKQPAVVEMMGKVPSWLMGFSPKVSTDRAAEIIIKNIETRSARNYSHFGVHLSHLIRGIIQCFDDSNSRRIGIDKIIEKHYADGKLSKIGEE